ncbi:MAG: YbaL family putative K(+) efflux transporter [Xanthobacteraceae bacterium]|uniref:YbaL family putative K(+) efflux transporter n=1 Tax=Pseudolabrys sp. TaxID=1960880 RepID=UPI003D11448C
MPHSTPLISTIVAGLVLAFLLAAVAQRLRLSPLVGYLVAGVLLGPGVPGFFTADQAIANELAEIGVILLMFGVGLHFSLKDLLAVRAIALPGAVVQIAVATLLGMGLAAWLGWSIGGGLVFGLALSVASTVVLLRAMQQRRLVETERGRIAVGWLIVEDLAMVLTLVLLPAVAPILKDGGAGGTDIVSLLTPLAITLGKVVAFVAVMLIVGRRIIPWMLHAVAHTGSRELFRLSVLAIALGVAFAAASLFGVSFALGAFFAGMVMSESELSQRAANETLPLRDAFSVLFFVSVGMLFDPAIVVRDFWPVLVTVLIIVFGKSVAAFAIVRLFGYPTPTALMISVSLAQIGEFSFILAGLGVALGLMPERGRDLVLAGAILSIMLNPLLFALLDRWAAADAAKQAAKEAAKEAAHAPAGAAPEPQAAPAEVETPAATAAHEPVPMTALTDHIVLIGHGRVGSFITATAPVGGPPFLIVEDEPQKAAALRAEGRDVITGNAADPAVLAATNITAARCVLVAIPDAFEGGQVVQQARALSPALRIVARAHSEAEIEHLMKHGATAVVMGEHEIAKAMLAHIPGPAGQSPADTPSAA